MRYKRVRRGKQLPRLGGFKEIISTKSLNIPTIWIGRNVRPDRNVATLYHRHVRWGIRHFSKRVNCPTPRT